MGKLKFIFPIIFIFIIFILVLIFFTTREFTSEKRGFSQPMNISYFQNFEVNKPSTQNLLSWENICQEDSECKYTERGSDGPRCLNLNHINNNSNLIIHGNVSCVCKLLIYERPVNTTGVTLWIEDEGSLICQEERIQQGIVFEKFEILPENPSINETVLFNTTIKNMGTKEYQQIQENIDFGDNFSVTILGSWCGHYGYTREQCKMQGAPYGFEPGETMYLEVRRPYASSGVFSISAWIHGIDFEGIADSIHYNTTLNISQPQLL